jgi:hypothetical protein
MAIMPKQFPKEQRERAIRMVLDHLDEYDTPFMACKAIGTAPSSVDSRGVEHQAAVAS